MNYPTKVELANLQTPLHAIFFEGFEILIKRDDLTGMEWTGNKIRKLEYILFDALQQKADVLITCGGIQSNHARATAAVAARLGLKSILYLRGKEPKSYDGNLALDKLFGADIKFVTQEEYDNIEEIVAKEINKLKKKGLKGYFIPEGGSNSLGIWGYIECAYELYKQFKQMKNKPSHIVTAVGSGGTLAGLLVGKKLWGLKSELVGINVLKTSDDFEKIVYDLACECNKKYKLGLKFSTNDFKILDGYSKEGYENITKEKLELLGLIAQDYGLLLDPVYTGKAFYGMVDHFIYQGNDFNKLLFLHTGGIFGVFPKLKKYLSAINEY